MSGDKPEPAKEMSVWLTVSESDAAVRTVPRVVPLRSLSTYQSQGTGDLDKVRYAPFPTIPMKREVQDAKLSTEQEIQRWRADLSVLQREKASLNQCTHTLNSSAAVEGVREYRGLLIEDATIRDVINGNRQRKAEAADLTSVGSSATFGSLVELPEYRATIERQRRNVVPLLISQVRERALIEEYSRDLANTYKANHDRGAANDMIVAEYSSKTDVKSSVWPSDFNMDVPKVDNARRLRWTAPDQKMLLSPRQRKSECYWDMNGLIDDPVKEHNEFRERLCWTNEERQMFLEIYRKYPKDFRKITAALPEKSHKDVIEFYYRNRYELCLKDNEGVARKRGGRKKVISEGIAKKNY